MFFATLRWGLVVTIGGLGAPAAVASTTVTTSKLKVLRTLPHSGYSEGLDWHEGFLWHALPKESVKIDPKDGSVVARFRPATEYNESLWWFRGVPYQVSFHDDGIYRGKFTDAGQLEWTRIGKTPEIHAWGSATDGKHVILTGNYSSKLYFLDPTSWKVVRTLQVSVPDLEDLAWDGQRIWTSSFTKYPGTIFPVDPVTGAVGGFYELPEPDECPIIDGLAWDGEALWLTGKHCPKIYRVDRPSARALSSPAKKKK
jgi:glutamine cyclotransferase